MATIDDVAARAGVGIGTVSRVLNGSQQVRDSTRDRVLTAIRELGYRPNSAARGLAYGRLHEVAIVVPFVTNPSAVVRVRGLVHGLRQSGYAISLFDVEQPAHREEHLTALTSNLRPEGVVVVSLRLAPEQLARFNAEGIRIVCIDAEVEDCSAVVIDDERGGELATEHLIGLGHRRIAFVGDEEGDAFGFTSSMRRRHGYRRALSAAGIEPDPTYQRRGPHGREVAHEQALALFDLDRPPTAVFAASDTQALGVLEAAKQRGLDVPGDLSIIGFDDIEVAGYADLTTIRQPLHDSGAAAARQLLAELADPASPSQRLELPLELVVRGSTGRPPH